MKKGSWLIVFGVLITSTAKAQIDTNHQNRMNSLKLIKENPYKVWDVAYVQKGDWTELYKIPNHPAFDSLLTPEVEQKLLKEINLRRSGLNKDTLFTADYFYVWKPYLDWLRNEDPHYRVTPSGTAPDDGLRSELTKNLKAQKRLPFHVYAIHDSIVIRTSYDDRFRSGDLILSINNIPMTEYVKCYYSDRYAQINGYLLNYHFELASPVFDVRVLRDNKEESIKTEGKSLGELFTLSSVPEEYNPTIYSDANCGYIQIKAFYSDNSRLIKIVIKELKNFKDKGIKNIIIDIRRNPGGSGDRFDKLLSLFINKPVIDYLKGQKLRVSEQALKDYDFLRADMIGKNINIPDEHVVKSVKLDNKNFIGGLNYYVLVSESTGSIAASFANMMQYHNAAIIVGEPLLRNAVKYGETIGGNVLSHTLLRETGISTTEFDEHTKAVDGILLPDIHIPYVAKEYMTGKDVVLEKLLEIIKSK